MLLWPSFVGDKPPFSWTKGIVQIDRGRGKKYIKPDEMSLHRCEIRFGGGVARSVDGGERNLPQKIFYYPSSSAISKRYSPHSLIKSYIILVFKFRCRKPYNLRKKIANLAALRRALISVIKYKDSLLLFVRYLYFYINL